MRKLVTLIGNDVKYLGEEQNVRALNKIKELVEASTKNFFKISRLDNNGNLEKPANSTRYIWHDWLGIEVYINPLPSDLSETELESFVKGIEFALNRLEMNYAFDDYSFSYVQE